MIDELCPPITVDGRTTYPAPSPGRFMARQPILDAQCKTIGYELLFLEGWNNTFSGEPNQATRRILDHCDCAFIGLSSLTQKELAFVNCTREALVHGLVTLMPASSTVLEILETVEPDAEPVAVCTELHRMGYALALNDFVPRKRMQSLVALATYIKVDYRTSDATQRCAIRQQARGTTAALLVEKVETKDDFTHALEEGCKYFQGFFLPPPHDGPRRIPPRRLSHLHLPTAPWSPLTPSA